MTKMGDPEAFPFGVTLSVSPDSSEEVHQAVDSLKDALSGHHITCGESPKVGSQQNVVWVRPSHPRYRAALIARAFEVKPAGVALCAVKEVDEFVTYEPEYFGPVSTNKPKKRSLLHSIGESIRDCVVLGRAYVQGR